MINEVSIIMLDCTKENRHLNEAVTTISAVSNFFLDNSPKKLNFLDKVYKVLLTWIFTELLVSVITKKGKGVHIYVSFYILFYSIYLFWVKNFAFVQIF